jgi:7-cyano-7-deazaguanine reductase
MDNDPPALTKLGNPTPGFPASPDEAELEAFANPRPGRAYEIRLDYPEFSSLCPVTGQPDTARLRIAYTPAERCVETKSLKLYLQSYRNYAAFNEEIANRIADDIIAACAPLKLRIVGRFSARGGIQLTVEVNHPDAVS